MPEIPIDASVTEGRCYFCDDPVTVPVGTDAVGRPILASELPPNPVLVRMCDECRRGFERWRDAEPDAPVN